MSFDDIIKKEPELYELVWRTCGNCKRYAGYPEEEMGKGYCHIADATVSHFDGCVDHLLSDSVTPLPI